jgi:predicted CxxxxCH...CXXCH cytochrome family protein
MLKKCALAALTTLLMPALALAGTIYSSTPTTSPIRGTISPAGYVFAPSTGTTTFTVKANPGYMIGSVTLDGTSLMPSGSVTGGATYAVPNKSLNQKIVAGFVGAVAPKLEAKLVTPVNAAVGTSFPLNGGSSTVSLPAGVVATYTWSITPSGASLSTLTGSTTTNSGIITTFSSATAGTYTVTLTLTAPGTSPSSATATVYVLRPIDAQNKLCTDCHQSARITEYRASQHYNGAVPISCADCHNPGNTLPHPGVTPSAAGVFPQCQSCHLQKFPAFANNTAHYRQGKNYWSYTNQNVCADCHNAHDPSTGFSTVSGLYPSYADAGHANYKSGAWNHPSTVTASEITKGARNCGRCHNMNSFLSYVQGFTDYSSGSSNPVVRAPYTWVHRTGSSASDQTILGCRGCHTDAKGTVRSIGAVTVYYNYTAAGNGLNGKVSAADYPSLRHTYPDSGSSNLCIACHTGRQSGESIVAWGEKFGGINTFNSTITTHDFPMGIDVYANLYNVTPYVAPLQAHESIGMANFANTGVAGPCATCHIFTGTDHSQAAVTLNADGTVAGIKKPAVCANCHLGLDLDKMNGAKSAYKNSLAVIAQLLLDKGLMGSVSGSYPNQQFTAATTFTYGGTLNINKYRVTGWGGGQLGTDNLGLAMNLDQMSNRDKAGYAHNPAYVRKMMADVIDLLDDGTMNGSSAATIANIVIDPAKIILPAGLTPEAVKSSAAANIGNKEQANCNSCHTVTATTGSHPAHLSLSISCATCHSATAVSSSALVPGTTKHLNGVNDVVVVPTGSYNLGTHTCSTVYCHSNGRGTYQSVVWGSGHLTCTACHPTLGGSHPMHVGNLLSSGQVTFYNFTGVYSTDSSYRFGCASCHPTDSALHNNGKVDVTLVAQASAGSLRSKNDPSVLVGGVGVSGSGITGTSNVSVVCSTSYCHSNGWTGGALVYAASPDWYNPGSYTGDRCAMCHGNSPNSTIVGSAAHGRHVVSIHNGLVVNPDGTFIPVAAAAGTVAGHGDPAQSTTINCDSCHSSTVLNSANDRNTACASCHAGDPKGTPTLGRASHVNGHADVVFKAAQVATKAQIDPASFSSYTSVWSRTTYKVDAASRDKTNSNLSLGTWNASGKNCMTSCHNNGEAKWEYKLSCVGCHSRL